jgi:hypothetical protein
VLKRKRRRGKGSKSAKEIGKVKEENEDERRKAK